MQKTLKKSISILLSILMIVGVFAVVPITASAAEETSTITWDSFTTSGGMSSGGVTLTTTSGNCRVGRNFYAGRGSATFTAPEGSAFTKIELKDCSYVDSLNFPGATVAQTGSYYDEWDEEWYNTYTVTWTGESSEVTFSGAIYGIQSIVFTLKSSAPATYTVTWKNYDGTDIGTSEVAEGETPAFSDEIGEIKAKPEDDDYTYSLSGWTPDVVAATADATYTAVFNGEPKHQAGYYAVGTMTNWKIDDNYLLTKNDAAQGDEYMLTNVALTANTAFKVVKYEAGQDWSWYPTGTGNDYEITSDGTYDIYFRPDYQGGNDWFYNCIYAAHTYTVTWKNWNGDVLETDENVAAGATPTYDGEAPERAADAQNTYTFAAWDDGTTTYVLGVDDLPAVTADVTYTAVFTAETNTYKVTWKNWDGNVLKVDENVPYGTVPEYKGARPEKPDVEDTAYTFTNWTPEVAAVTGDVEYTAEFGVHELIGDYYYVNGQRVGTYYGLIKYDGDFYYVDKYAKIIKNDEHCLVTTNGWTFADGTPIPKATYSFDADGKMIIPNGIDGDYYYIDGVRVGSYYGLVKDGNDYYYVDANAKIVKNKTKFLTTTNDLTFPDGTPIPNASYSFDADGKMIIPNGIDGDFYYINGVKVGSYYGLVKDGNDYYYVDANAKIVKSKNKYLTTTNDLTFPDGTPIPHKYFEFDADGKMIIPNGIDGDYYYINGVKVGSYYGLVKDGNDYYYVDANAKIVKSKNKYLTTTNDLTFPDGTPIPHKYFEFDADGKMIIPPEHASAPAVTSFTKVTNVNQITEDNIGESTFEEAKAWVLANWDDIMSTGHDVDVVHFVGTDLQYIYISKDISKQFFEDIAGDGDTNIGSLQYWFTNSNEEVYLCSKAS